MDNGGEINGFFEEYRFLSNFYPARFEWDGVTASTLEHHYVAAKTMDQEQRAMIYALESPGDVKRAGRTLTLRDGWDDGIKEAVMAELISLKFAIPDLRSALVGTFPARLVEGNDWHDQIWGSCNCDKHIDIPGQNRLGEALMCEREAILNNG